MVDYRGIVTLALKLLGLWLIVDGVADAVRLLPSVFSSSVPMDPLYSIYPLVPLLFGSFLWLFPARVANTIVHPGLPQATEWAVTLERIGMSLLGVFLLFQSLSGLASHVMFFRAQSALELDAARVFYPALVARIVQAAVALVLVLGSEGIVNALAKLREAGTRRTPPGPP
jgi:hypothetical protein